MSPYASKSAAAAARSPVLLMRCTSASSRPAASRKAAASVTTTWRSPSRVRSSMADEMIYQTFINRSDDVAEMKAAREDDRAPRYTGS